MTLSRRNLLWSASALGLLLLAPRRLVRAAAPDAPRRYLLHLIAQGGLDTASMFDARPMAMTAAGKIHNPHNVDPAVWTGTNGQTALAAPPTQALASIRDRFSVLNGVVMSTTFDGHDQNTNLFLAGSPFGGSSFAATLNTITPSPLDYVRLGTIIGAELQDPRAIPLSEPGFAQLKSGVNALGKISPFVDDFLASESATLGSNTKRFGAGVAALDRATLASTDLRERIESVDLGSESDPLDAQLAVVRELFRLDIARGAMLAINGDDLFFDNHAPQAAQAQAPSYVELCTRIARVFKFLAATPFDDTHSLADVTTVVVGSEFGRTMRQLNNPITNTGTDHNPLSSTVLVGGAGIRGGLVLGASDFQTANETLSGAHTTLDPENVKVMGRPFDFSAAAPRSDRPAGFAATDYLQIASVINTIYSLFGVESAAWRLTERGGDAAPVIHDLLA
ncbi:MAG TPA: DUF1501 domain-containing protein [Kofleriaceae bacterium]|nr:DUF1501 domain-containing protein [Kofleriaceae bacterium]